HTATVNKPAIADGHVVTLHYRLTLDDGSIADESFGQEPLVYLHGAQNIVPGLERELTGRNVGDACDISVAAADGYGEYDPAAAQTVPRSAFLPNVDLAPGMAFQARGRNGQPQSVWVRSVAGDQVVVSTNHPM